MVLFLTASWSPVGQAGFLTRYLRARMQSFLLPSLRGHTASLPPIFIGQRKSEGPGMDERKYMPPCGGRTGSQPAKGQHLGPEEAL